MSDFQLFIDAIKSDSDGEIENKFKIEYLEMTDKDSWRPLHHACCYGRLGLVELLFLNFCKINSSTNIGCQPIHLASKNGHIDIVKILIANKCDINAADEYGYQPIHLACENVHIDIVKILIKNKCDINAADRKGYQTVHLACKNGHIDIVKILIANKCDVNASTNNGYQPIHFACESGHIDIVKILIENKCDINSYDKIFGNRPIHLACKNGHIDIVKILIANKCDINAADKTFGNRPIHFSCENGRIDIVKILIANKCDINAADNRGYQPIHLVCLKGHIDIVKILIENNCDMKSLTKNRKLPIDIAKQEKFKQIIDILNAADPILSITTAMNLQCSINCDHKFCRKTLNEQEIKGGDLIGKGAFGEVYKHKISNTNQEIVIKQTKYDCEDKQNIEININKFSSEIIHKNIVRYFGAVEKSGKLCIFMEYIPGGSLQSRIDEAGMIGINKVIQYSKQILVGLQFLHSKAIIHRDIKPANILLDNEETLKLADFGVSRTLQKSNSKSIVQASTFCGTPHYLAPEIFSGEPYDYSADIWSTGATVIHMITGKVPYHNLSPHVVMNKIGVTRKIEFTLSPQISKTIQSFINDLLTPDQSKRPSADLLLKHSIFINVR